MKVAVLVDLPRDKNAGGHVKYWERIAQAAAKQNSDLDLTIYFSGCGADEILSPYVRYRFLPPVFSTARLKFLPYIPAHTDLASFHPQLAKELSSYDVIHTTEGAFAFARTAERVARGNHIPLTTSFHTDTPAYAEVFTRQIMATLLGKRLGGWVDGFFRISRCERAAKTRRLKKHLRACSGILAMRPEDIALTQSVVSADKIHKMRLGIDKDIFAPRPDMRRVIEEKYRIPPHKFLVLFVGRIDAGKNVSRLIEASVALLEKNIPLHLAVIGRGPLESDIKEKLGIHATLAGILPPEELAKFYASGDCLAVTSDIEIGGMIGLEALACGCPVIVSRQSGMAQLCGNTEAMQQVESDLASWIEVLANFSQNPDRQAAMRREALAFREDKMASWGDVLSQDFVPVWRSLVQGKKK